MNCAPCTGEGPRRAGAHCRSGTGGTQMHAAELPCAAAAGGSPSCPGTSEAACAAACMHCIAAAAEGRLRWFGTHLWPPLRRTGQTLAPGSTHVSRASAGVHHGCSALPTQARCQQCRPSCYAHTTPPCAGPAGAVRQLLLGKPPLTDQLSCPCCREDHRRHIWREPGAQQMIQPAASASPFTHSWHCCRNCWLM